MYPNSFPDVTPKAHFLGLSLKLNFSMRSRIGPRSGRWVVHCMLLAKVSST
jgi:hypothetical protein